MTVDSNGLTVTDYADRRQANAATLQSLAGANVTTEERTIEGDLVTLISLAGQAAEDQVAAVYSATWFRTASGPALDRHAEFVIGPRTRATSSVASAIPLTGTAGTVIPAGSAITPVGTTVRWLLLAEVTLDGAGEGEGDFEAESTGPIAAVTGTTWTISTPSAGWTGAGPSPTDAELGNDDELDESYRNRLAEAVRSGPIGRAIARVPGVTLVTVLEHPHDYPDAYHGKRNWIEPLVVGGDDDAVAIAIHEARGPGITVLGNTLVNVDDDQYKGGQVPIRFSRPDEVAIYVKVTITKGEAYPKTTGTTALDARAAAVKNAILTWAATALQPSVDVSAFQIAASAANAVVGIKSLAVLVGTVNPPVGSEVEIDVREQARLTAARIEVIE